MYANICKKNAHVIQVLLYEKTSLEILNLSYFGNILTVLRGEPCAQTCWRSK